MFISFLKALGRLPLRCLHALGIALGWLVFACSRSYAERLERNIRQSGLYASESEYRALKRASIAEAGKSVVEVLAVWLRQDARVAAMIREVSNLELIGAARREGRGILILAPHLGCFEIVGFYFGQMMPFTVLYRPPRQAWLEPLMKRGRLRGHVELAATSLAGVRRVLRALRDARGVGILPDQAPSFGEGVWAPFFGRPAWTMTLSNRLRRATRCASFIVFAERLPKGAGFHIHIEPLPAEAGDESQLNAAVEDAVRRCPAQYLWGYDRYKNRSGTAAPLVADADPVRRGAH
jgi:KDO2-lipid IV(A) lauroyltransferase